MSATVDADKFSLYWRCPVLYVEGRLFPVNIRYTVPWYIALSFPELAVSFPINGVQALSCQHQAYRWYRSTLPCLSLYWRCSVLCVEGRLFPLSCQHQVYRGTVTPSFPVLAVSFPLCGGQALSSFLSISGIPWYSNTVFPVLRIRTTFDRIRIRLKGPDPDPAP